VLYEAEGPGRTPLGQSPTLLKLTLAALTDDPEGLFEKLYAFAGGQPPRRAADHYRAIFEYLCERLGARPGSSAPA